MENKNMVQETMSERLKSQTSAQNQESSSQSGELIEREQVDNTPFTLVTTDGGKSWFLALGRYRMTDLKTGIEAKVQLKELVRGKDWKLVLDTIVALTETAVEAMLIKPEKANPLDNLNLKGLTKLHEKEKEK